MQTQKVKTAWDIHTACRVIKQKFKIAWDIHTACRVIKQKFKIAWDIHTACRVIKITEMLSQNLVDLCLHIVNSAIPSKEHSNGYRT